MTRPQTASLMLWLTLVSSMALGQPSHDSPESLILDKRLSAIQLLASYAQLVGDPGKPETQDFQDLFAEDATVVIDHPASPQFGTSSNVASYLNVRRAYQDDRPTSPRCRPIQFVASPAPDQMTLRFSKSCGGITTKLGQNPQLWRIETEVLLEMDIQFTDAGLLISAIRPAAETEMIPIDLFQLVLDGHAVDTTVWTLSEKDWEPLKGSTKDVRLARRQGQSGHPSVQLALDSLWEHEVATTPSPLPETPLVSANWTEEDIARVRNAFAPHRYELLRSRNHLQIRFGRFKHQLDSDEGGALTALDGTLGMVMYGCEWKDERLWGLDFSAGAFWEGLSGHVTPLDWTTTSPTLDPNGTQYDRNTTVTSWSETTSASSLGLALSARGTRRWQSKASNYPNWSIQIEGMMLIGLAGSGQATSNARLHHSGTFPSLFGVTMDRPGILDFGPHEARGKSEWQGHRGSGTLLSLIATHRLDRRGSQCSFGLWGKTLGNVLSGTTNTSYVYDTNQLSSIVRTAQTRRGWGFFLSYQHPLPLK